ncbi:hypothetical protein Golomagni_04754 [Golovinomyces magnicellulatus]|nr:hypothetical protein Golomagni_04754 [Golovinomyces magnicellulatus]
MRLLLVRHGETVDNVAGIYAGITDSPLTNHGMVQSRKLGQFLRSNDTHIERIFSSDLQRSFLTAEAIRKSQKTTAAPVIRLEILREKNFGKYEGTKISRGGVESTSISSRPVSNTGMIEMSHGTESSRSMKTRAESFIDLHLAPSLRDASENSTIIVVSHGIFLGHLWRELLRNFDTEVISKTLTHTNSMESLEKIKGWYNTAYLELCITRRCKEKIFSSNSTPVNDQTLHSATCIQSAQSPQKSTYTLGKNNTNHHASSNKLLSQMQMTVMSINRRDHLEGVRKSRRGTGSLKYEPTQRTMFSYFAKKD